MATLERPTPAMPVRSWPSRTWRRSSLVLVTDAVPTGTARVEPDFVHLVPPSSMMIGLTVMPGVFMLIKRKLMLPACGLRCWCAPARRSSRRTAERVPGLLAVDDVVLAVGVGAAHGTCLERREVGAGARFGITLAPPVFTRDDARPVVRLLGSVAETHDHRGHHLHAERQLHRRAGFGALFVEDVALHGVPSGAAVFFGQLDAPQPLAFRICCHVVMSSARWLSPRRRGCESRGKVWR